MDEIKYKKPLSIKEQVDYLEKNKHVVYNECSKDKAMQYLYCHNYINVVSPFKENFARRDENNNIVRDENGNHIYDFPVDFSQYLNLYALERIKYPTIYTNIMNFETAFNAIVSYEVINHYEIKDEIRFKMFVEIMQENINSFVESGRLKPSVANHMRNDISKFESLMKNYNSIYIFMDRLSLSQTISVYKAVNVSLNNKIFNSLSKNNLTFGYESSGSFDNFLEIVVNYYDICSKKQRLKSDKARYLKVVAKLSKLDWE